MILGPTSFATLTNKSSDMAQWLFTLQELLKSVMALRKNIGSHVVGSVRGVHTPLALGVARGGPLRFPQLAVLFSE